MLNLRKDDEWMTPKIYWELATQIVPSGKIWEPFFGSGESTKFLKELGYNVVTSNDFWDIKKAKAKLVITNPPYSCKKKVITKLENLGVNYMLLLPASYMFTQFWMSKAKNNKDYSVAICPKRYGFMKDGVVQRQCPFNCAFFCYGIKTPSHYFYLMGT